MDCGCKHGCSKIAIKRQRLSNLCVFMKSSTCLFSCSGCLQNMATLMANTSFGLKSVKSLKIRDTYIFINGSVMKILAKLEWCEKGVS